MDETAGVNGSIFRYFLSSFQAKLMVPGVSKIYENPDEEVDVKELHNVFFLLDNAQVGAVVWECLSEVLKAVIDIVF